MRHRVLCETCTEAEETVALETTNETPCSVWGMYWGRRNSCSRNDKWDRPCSVWDMYWGRRNSCSRNDKWDRPCSVRGVCWGRRKIWRSKHNESYVAKKQVERWDNNRRNAPAEFRFADLLRLFVGWLCLQCDTDGKPIWFVKTVRWSLAVRFETSSLYGLVTDVVPVARTIFFSRVESTVFNN